MMAGIDGDLLFRGMIRGLANQGHNTCQVPVVLIDDTRTTKKGSLAKTERNTSTSIKCIDLLSTLTKKLINTFFFIK